MISHKIGVKRLLTIHCEQRSHLRLDIFASSLVAEGEVRHLLHEAEVLREVRSRRHEEEEDRPAGREEDRRDHLDLFRENSSFAFFGSE